MSGSCLLLIFMGLSLSVSLMDIKKDGLELEKKMLVMAGMDGFKSLFAGAVIMEFD